MHSIEKSRLPADSLLQRLYAQRGYTDCYTTEVGGRVNLGQFVSAFYTTPLFKIERLILKVFAQKPSTDVDVRQLVDGTATNFAAWSVEARTDNELLMCDFLSRTRSWFMVKGDGGKTQLYFGSAVVPKTGTTSLEFGFRALLAFHKLYSVFLLYSATSKIFHGRGDSK